MSQISETNLPGVGVRYEFVTSEGQRVGVIHHRTGRLELFACTRDDPDRASLSLDLSETDSHALIDVLGGSQVVQKLANLQQDIEGLAMDWLVVQPGSRYAERTIGDAHIRSRTGVSVVAVIRGDEHFPAPGPEFRVETGDTLVVVGTPEGIETVGEILAHG